MVLMERVDGRTKDGPGTEGRLLLPEPNRLVNHTTSKSICLHAFGGSNSLEDQRVHEQSSAEPSRTATPP